MCSCVPQGNKCNTSGLGAAKKRRQKLGPKRLPDSFSTTAHVSGPQQVSSSRERVYDPGCRIEAPDYDRSASAGCLRPL